jgi:tungstate transport system substrate-binding protein
MENGDAIDRRLVMHNDFIFVGPPSDPANVKRFDSPAIALAEIVDNGAYFVSRGDDSGTHKKELAMWKQAGVQPEGDWYLQSGQGMGATLRIASEKNAYTMTDRATYLALQHTLDQSIVLEGDPSMLNVYHTMRVNPANWPSVNEQGTIAWSEFLVSEEGQNIIAEFGNERFGQPLFFPDAGKQGFEIGSD